MRASIALKSVGTVGQQANNKFSSRLLVLWTNEFTLGHLFSPTSSVLLSLQGTVKLTHFLVSRDIVHFNNLSRVRVECTHLRLVHLQGCDFYLFNYLPSRWEIKTMIAHVLWKGRSKVLVGFFAC